MNSHSESESPTEADSALTTDVVVQAVPDVPEEIGQECEADAASEDGTEEKGTASPDASDPVTSIHPTLRGLRVVHGGKNQAILQAITHISVAIAGSLLIAIVVFHEILNNRPPSTLGLVAHTLAIGWAVYFGFLALAIVLAGSASWLSMVLFSPSMAMSVSEAASYGLLLKNHVAALLCAISMRVAAQMYSNGSVGNAKTLLNSLSVLVIFLFFYACKKLFMQRVAVNYHSCYYDERVRSNKFCLEAIRRIIKKHPLVTESGAAISCPTIELLEQMDPIEVGSSIFNSLCSEGEDELVSEDLHAVLSPKDSVRFFELCDRDGNGDLSQQEVIDAVQDMFTERHVLHKALSTTGDVVSHLNSVVMILVVMLTAIFSGAIIGVSFEGAVAFLGAAVVSIEYVFDEILDVMFKTIKYIFVLHPFDIGDKVVINKKDYEVRQIGWYKTTFIDDTNTVVYKKNSKLCDAVIGNTRRSGPMTETVSIIVSMETTADQITALEDSMRKFLDDNPRDYRKNLTISIAELLDAKSMRLSFQLSYKSNLQNSAIKKKRRNAFFNELRDLLASLHIEISQYAPLLHSRA